MRCRRRVKGWHRLGQWCVLVTHGLFALTLTPCPTQRRGARDLVTKPWDNPRLLAIVRNQIDLGSARRAYHRLEQENEICAAAANRARL